MRCLVQVLVPNPSHALADSVILTFTCLQYIPETPSPEWLMLPVTNVSDKTMMYFIEAVKNRRDLEFKCAREERSPDR